MTAVGLRTPRSTLLTSLERRRRRGSNAMYVIVRTDGQGRRRPSEGCAGGSLLAVASPNAGIVGLGCGTKHAEANRFSVVGTPRHDWVPFPYAARYGEPFRSASRPGTHGYGRIRSDPARRSHHLIAV
jgi:hypothetical protein